MEEQTVSFYHRVGFEKLNDVERNNGFELLPSSLRTILNASKSFISTDACPMLLFCWTSQIDEPEAVVPASLPEPPTEHVKRDITDYIWCGFPRQRSTHDGTSIELDHNDLVSATAGLDLLNELRPPMSTYRLLPPEEHILKGELMARNRLKENRHKGEEWMKTGDMEAVLSFFMSDGRYNDNVFIVRPSHMEVLSRAYFQHVDYETQKAKVEFLRSGVAELTIEADDLRAILFTEETKLAVAETKQNQSFNRVLELMVEPFPNMMEKRLLFLFQPRTICIGRWYLCSILLLLEHWTVKSTRKGVVSSATAGITATARHA